MRFDINRIRQNVSEADTEDLLDRVTVYREGMEPEALEAIEAELRSRKVRPAQIDDHARRRQSEVLWLPDGTAASCSFCDRPAVTEGRGWYRLLGIVPLFRRRFFYCALHRRDAKPPRATSDSSARPRPRE